MRILGIDPGSRLCGYGVIERLPAAGGLRYIECGVLSASESQPMEQRVGLIAAQLQDLIRELRPAVVALEDVFSHHNPRSALALAQARGMALAVIGLESLRVFSYPPAVVKKTVTGSGRADKDQVGRMVQALLGLHRVPSADAADAVAVAITHARIESPGAARLAPALIAAVSPSRSARKEDV